MKKLDEKDNFDSVKGICNESVAEEFEGNRWSNWGETLKERVIDSIKDEVGDRVNAHHFESLANYLIKDLALFPLWSNILAKEMGFEGINPSSSAIEQIFRKIKNDVFTKNELPLRIDEFVPKHIHYLQGKVTLLNFDKKEVFDTSEKSSEISESLEFEMDTSHTIQIIENSNNCPACKNEKELTQNEKNDPLTGSHFCVLCKQRVHALDACSVPINEEGYGQKRACLLCWNDKDFKKNMALKDFENWGNFGVINEKIEESKKRKISQSTEMKSKKRKTGLYLGEKKSTIKDKIAIEPCKKLKTLRNGNDKNLSSIRLSEKDVYLRNTCAFDSIFQILLTAAHDFEEFDQVVSFKYFLNFHPKRCIICESKSTFI